MMLLFFILFCFWVVVFLDFFFFFLFFYLCQVSPQSFSLLFTLGRFRRNCGLINSTWWPSLLLVVFSVWVLVHVYLRILWNRMRDMMHSLRLPITVYVTALVRVYQLTCVLEMCGVVDTDPALKSAQRYENKSLWSNRFLCWVNT